MSTLTKNRWIEQLEQAQEQIVEWRRHMHANPELSFQETNTARFIAEQLTSFGYEVRTNVGGNGILADLKGAHPGKAIAFRADFDALPIPEENDVPYKSQNPGVMHACGHDGHTSTLLGVAKVLADQQDSLRGSLRFIFQHAEEKLPGGAKSMIEDGALDGIDEVYGAHLASYMPLGKLSVSSGPSMAAVDSFSITVQGKGGHGAKPHQTVDAIVVGSQLVTALQHIVARHINPLKSAVVTVGVFQAGAAFNVIADKAKIEGTVRSFDPDVRKQLERDIRDMIHGITLAEHATYELEYVNGYPALVNPPQQAEEIRAVFTRQFGEEALFGLDASMGAEDFAYYLQERPGNFFNVGSQNDSEDTAFPHHHPRFDIDERALLVAGKAFLAIAADKLLDEA
ncbi:M20 family metallopeptidase [Saccharibacillus sp. CPCC 101409]|uniref:M20 metallopeptidase family protein n=1 Tax=Saccharibacillus sp. CPCC 101409 TaxID=3058041 RepID=UPI002673C2E7|nr:M20 family metallopeptidase [Saccharibacillus sp. CPCC 101409]MDO3410286.1 M20 family metallopeptidase [Saccharibacillus sp. CPCC 101409]